MSKNNKFLDKLMRQITGKHMNICLNKAYEMLEKYKTWTKAIDGFPRDVDVFGNVCVRDLEVNIKVFVVDVVPEEIKEILGGLCLVNEDGSFEINLHPDLNECWQRFILCKELFHVLLDAQEYRNMDLYAHLEQLTLLMPADEDGIYLPGTSELMAEIAAMEFLFPYSERLKVKSKSTINLLDVATVYRVPQKFVALYLSDAVMHFLAPFCN